MFLVQLTALCPSRLLNHRKSCRGKFGGRWPAACDGTSSAANRRLLLLQPGGGWLATSQGLSPTGKPSARVLVFHSVTLVSRPGSSPAQAAGTVCSEDSQPGSPPRGSIVSRIAPAGDLRVWDTLYSYSVTQCHACVTLVSRSGFHSVTLCYACFSKSILSFKTARKG